MNDSKTINNKVLISFIIPTIRNKNLTLKSVNEAMKHFNSEVIVVRDIWGRNASKARNEGAKRAKGEILIFCDDDIAFSQHLLHSVINLLNSKNGERFLIGIANFDKFFGHYCISRFLCLKRTLFEKIGGFDENIGYMGEDVEFSIRAKMNGAIIVKINNNEILHINNKRSKESFIKYLLNQYHLTYTAIKHINYFRYNIILFFIKKIF